MKIDPVYLKIFAGIFVVSGLGVVFWGASLQSNTPREIPDPDSFIFYYDGTVHSYRMMPNPDYPLGGLLVKVGIVEIGLAAGLHVLSKRESLELRFPEER